MRMINHKNDLIAYLYTIGAIQIGEFRLVGGTISPIYINLCRIISFPDIYQYIIDLFAHEIIEKKYNHIVGVPYSAIPLAAGIAVLYQKPMIMIRKGDHDQGRIEGIFKKGEAAIIIEDITASGTSIEHTIDVLLAAGIHVHEAIVFMDRQQGAKKRLARKGITLHALCTLSDVLTILHQQGHLDKSTIAAIDHFIDEHQF